LGDYFHCFEADGGYFLSGKDLIVYFGKERLQLNDQIILAVYLYFNFWGMGTGIVGNNFHQV
jgi:hypothetical protein